MIKEENKEMKVHELKIKDKYFSEVASGQKRAEIRYNDRDFKVGDRIRLFEYKDNIETGEVIEREISHILSHEEFEGLENGYVMLSIKTID